MGIVDYFRIPKRAWYWYRRAYRGIEPPVWPIQGKPVALRLEVIGNKEVLADGTDDVQLLVTVVGRPGRGFWWTFFLEWRAGGGTPG